ncbi:MAG: hypothetical protein AAF492_09415, partial [Verrucomicrobiota bacterium]
MMKTHRFLSLGLLLAGLALPAPAQVRSSARYSIPVEVLDTGGLRASNAVGTVVLDGSLGGFGGLSSLGADVMKHGYIGQLYELVDLQL